MGMATRGDDRLISRREAAELAGVHYNTVRLWERTGRLTPHKADGGEVMIDKAELEGVVIERQQGGPHDEREKIAALEAEVRELRERLAEEKEQRTRLLDAIVQLAEGKEGRRA